MRRFASCHWQRTEQRALSPAHSNHQRSPPVAQRDPSTASHRGATYLKWLAMAGSTGSRWLSLLRAVPRRGLGAAVSIPASTPAPSRGRPYADLQVGVARETFPGERRVALSPAGVAALAKAGFGGVRVQAGAGAAAQFNDAAYVAAGAKVVESAEEALAADVVLAVRPLAVEQVGALKPGATVYGYVQPAVNHELVDALVRQRVSVLAMDQIPRTLSRAQAFDTLSSMANIAGYRAVVEAANAFGRFFGGQITAAGKVPPATALVVGGGVAGLSATMSLKNLGAVVRLFDTRPAVEEQAKSLGAQFLKVDIAEDGSGAGGYAKEMSKEYHEAQLKLFMDQAREVDVIVTTALIPGRPAPLLITQEMIDVMKPGSVIVDLAAEMGGNAAATVPGEAIVTPNGVTCIGYTDLVSRLPEQSSTLYSNNITKFLLSTGPHTTKEKGRLYIDPEDQAVRGALVAHNGEITWPAPPLPPAPPPKKMPVTVVPEGVFDPHAAAKRTAKLASGAVGTVLALGVASTNPATSAMISKLGLAGICGYQTVNNVAPALHSPLMSATNFLSGLTASGAICCMSGGFLPDTTAAALAATALLASAVNLGGGFTVTQRMLDMFRRKDDPEDHNLDAIKVPMAALVVGSGLGIGLGATEMASLAYLGSSAACIGSIACFSQQKTAQLGNALAVLGVTGGLATTLAVTPTTFPLLMQMAGCLGAGGAVGRAIAKRMKITELPQAVAAFHTLVGLAAVTTSAASFLATADPAHLDLTHKIAAYLGTFIGAVTLTGSGVAFGKLHGLLPGKALNLPSKNRLNVGLMAGNTLGGLVFLASGSPAIGAGCLAACTAMAGTLGAHVCMSIGASDVAVAICLLNAYSGFALVAEGFLLNNDLLTIVGALIGSSGSILSYHMCHSMNRSLANVILGGVDNVAKPKSSKVDVDADELVHVEVDTSHVADALTSARKVTIVPGYGLAVASAQYAVADMVKTLREKGNVDVRFAIHPVGTLPAQFASSSRRDFASCMCTSFDL
jgi:H+-translocating NAD(P) transhydrogenase